MTLPDAVFPVEQFQPPFLHVLPFGQLVWLEVRFDGERYEFQILVESPESARGHGGRLEDVFTDGITLVDSDTLRDLKQEVLNSA
nr:hypothetical protein [Halomicrobium zhouii]